MFVTVIRRFSRTRGKSQRDLALRRRLAVEHLEQRTMLSIGPSSIINTGAGSGVGDGLPASNSRPSSKPWPTCPSRRSRPSHRQSARTSLRIMQHPVRRA